MSVAPGFGRGLFVYSRVRISFDNNAMVSALRLIESA